MNNFTLTLRSDTIIIDDIPSFHSNVGVNNRSGDIMYCAYIDKNVTVHDIDKNMQKITFFLDDVKYELPSYMFTRI